MIHAWCASVWQAYRGIHAEIRSLCVNLLTESSDWDSQANYPVVIVRQNLTLCLIVLLYFAECCFELLTPNRMMAPNHRPAIPTDIFQG